MSNQEILEKAIQKAIDGGWRANGSEPDWNVKRVFEWLDLYDDHMIADVIFNKEFARALWGEEPYSPVKGLYRWQWKLQQMVIADDPIAYLGEHL